ncbi:MAG: YegS/Rv2252/BmrU family lipid kinase [Oscillospiraceae bacterium]|nr:YegS/Rv2252/BmrU family lipid kinase [Oscillospiraceae bacterium]
MKHLFIINPAAGKKASTVELDKLLTTLSFDHEVVYTKQAGDAERIARTAAETGEQLRIYACGGDGTLNEVVNGAAGFDNVAITCVPKGTGNDFLKIFGPNYRQLFYDLEALAIGPQTPFDLIDCNGKLGIDMVCAGVDARIGAGVHRYKRWHFVSGMGAYVLSLLEHVLFKGISRPLHVEMGEQVLDDPSALLCVCNGRYYGGGFMPVPEAMPDDGVLDMLHVNKVSLYQLPTLLGKYATGRYKELPRFVTDFHGQSISFRSDEEITAVVDGEVMYDTAFTVRLSERKVNFFYPAQASYAVEFSTPSQVEKVTL